MTGTDLLWALPIMIAFGFAVLGLLVGDSLPDWAKDIADWSAAGLGAFAVVSPAFVIALIVTGSMPITILVTLVVMHFGGRFVIRSVDSDIKRRGERASKSIEARRNRE